jgi:DNA-binding MarR family transcriptional regulator
LLIINIYYLLQIRAVHKLDAWLKDGPYRLRIITLLQFHPYIPSELASELNLHRSSMSRILNDLKRVKLVTASPGGSRTINYSLTEKGKKIAVSFHDR